MTIENLATFYHGGDLRGAAAVVVGETFFSYNDERKKKKKKKKFLFFSSFCFRSAGECGAALFAFSSTMGFYFVSLLDGKVEFCALDGPFVIIQVAFLKGIYIRRQQQQKQQQP